MNRYKKCIHSNRTANDCVAADATTLVANAYVGQIQQNNYFITYKTKHIKQICCLAFHVLHAYTRTDLRNAHQDGFYTIFE